MTALVTPGTGIQPGWIDYNGHLMDGYYLVAFSDATEAVLQELGFGPTYRERSGCTIYTVEAHVTFRREVSADTRLSFTTLVVDHDDKRIHVVHAMLDPSTGELLATAELMFIHVRQSSGKVEPFAAEHATKVAAMARAHAELPRPVELGRRIGMRGDAAAT